MQKFPETAQEYIGLAERAVDQFTKTQQIDDLFTAILATAHSFDFFHRETRGRPTEEGDKQVFANENPDWKTIRQLCNGGTTAKMIGVGDDGSFPYSADESLRKRLVWVVPFDGSDHRVDFLCARFLARLTASLSKFQEANPDRDLAAQGADRDGD
ncbi:hypothetical protein [Chelatococcus asaccharovorans]|uniref:Uncharacterized protein n=1 Tax=Chelatococcus asaccharovorans TaxID=28210 RepID=A0A2V3U9R2_9HYPH|nr:hypothetical protein [Chelatococcus asaccharovorans]MBS7705585.1 hypothetical protein [Chelatococcus asaccharovorans]PXW60004.1 hypothetical protein C7450_10454 [Chelatococcus asaccharovorans]